MQKYNFVAQSRPRFTDTQIWMICLPTTYCTLCTLSGIKDYITCPTLGNDNFCNHEDGTNHLNQVNSITSPCPFCFTISEYYPFVCGQWTTPSWLGGWCTPSLIYFCLTYTDSTGRRQAAEWQAITRIKSYLRQQTDPGLHRWFVTKSFVRQQLQQFMGDRSIRWRLNIPKVIILQQCTK